MYEFLYLCKVAAMRLPVRAYRALQLSQISVISDLSLWNRIFDVVSSVATIYNLNLLTHWRRLVAKSILITEIWDNCDNWGACGGHWKKPHPAKKTSLNPLIINAKIVFLKTWRKNSPNRPPKFGSAAHCAYLCTVEAKTQRNINHQPLTINH